LVIDCTTIGPSAAREFAAELSAHGLRYVDAPVAGSIGPATEGTLGVLAGASEQDFADAEPLLQLWGDPARVRRVGQVGAGSAAKLVVNQALGIAVAGLGEALAIAKDLDIDRDVALALLEAGPYGFTITQKRAMLDSGDYGATTFSTELLAKDLDLVVAETGPELAVTTAAGNAARAAVDAGHGSEDYAAVAAYVATSPPELR
jgi:3-hydroxyisobutyrate dehydrogenase